MWSLQLHFFGKKNIQPVVMPNKSWDIDLKQFLKTFWKFRLIRILMNQLHNLVFLSCSPTKNYEISFSKLAGEKPTCDDGEVWLRETN